MLYYIPFLRGPLYNNMPPLTIPTHVSDTPIYNVIKAVVYYCCVRHII